MPTPRLAERDWQSALARLRECYPSDDALSRELGYERNRVRIVADNPSEAGEDMKEAIMALHHQIKDEHIAKDQAAITLLQTITWIEDEILTDEQLHVIEERWSRTKRQVQDLIDDPT